MSDTPNNGPEPAGGRPDYDDEISLVDLLVVLIRRRRLVIGLPLLAGLLSGIWLFVVPLLMPGEQGSGFNYEISLSAELRMVPSELSQTLNFDSVNNSRAVLTDINVVGEAYSTVFPESQEERTREQYNSYIRREIVGEELSVSHDTSTGLLTLRYTSTELEASLEFLELLMAAARTDLRVRLDRSIDNARTGLVRDFETRRAQLESAVAFTLRTGAGASDLSETDVARLVVDSAESNITAFAEAQTALQELELLRSDQQFPLGELQEPVVFGDPVSRGRSVRLVVTVFAVFFLAVFLAFVLEYARRVKEDPQESAKIKAAWRGE